MREHAILVAILVVAVGCGDNSEDCTVDESYNPTIDPSRFVAAIDNPLYPLVPGTSFVYMGGDERVEVVVMSERKMILGVSAVVVRDTATINGEVIEDTFDWFAQDVDGNVWYFGEDTKEYEDGHVSSTEGSWEGGVDGAKPGIVIPAQPAVGMSYRQEYAACEAEDMGEVVALAETVTVPTGTYQNCLRTRDTTPLDPEIDESKYYCPTVGLVLSVDTPTGDREELVQKTP